MNFDIKTLVMLGGLAVAFGGFYYGTELRLTHLEEVVVEVKEANSNLKTQVQKMNRRIKKLENEVN